MRIQVNLDMTDSMGPEILVRHMQNLSYTYDTYLICMGLGPSISSVIDKNPSYSGPSYPSSPVVVNWISRSSLKNRKPQFFPIVNFGHPVSLFLLLRSWVESNSIKTPLWQRSKLEGAWSPGRGVQLSHCRTSLRQGLQTVRQASNSKQFNLEFFANYDQLSLLHISLELFLI